MLVGLGQPILSLAVIALGVDMCCSPAHWGVRKNQAWGLLKRFSSLLKQNTGQVLASSCLWTLLHEDTSLELLQNHEGKAKNIQSR